MGCSPPTWSNISPSRAGFIAIASLAAAAGWTIASAQRMLRPKQKLPPDHQPPAGVRLHALPGSDDRPIILWIYDADRPRGVLIACHGYYANQRQVQPMAEGLRRRGYSVISCTWRGHGARGGWTTFGREEVADLSAILDWLQTQPAWGSLPVGVVGWSFGGAMVCQAAAVRPDLRAVITDSTYARLLPVLKHVIWRDYHLPPVPCAYLTWWGVQAAVRRRLSRVDPVRLAPRLRQPLLLIHGMVDQSVPPAHAHALYAAWQGSKQQWLLPGAGHVGACGADPDVYCDRVIEFCDTWLHPTRP